MICLWTQLLNGSFIIRRLWEVGSPTIIFHTKKYPELCWFMRTIVRIDAINALYCAVPCERCCNWNWSSLVYCTASVGWLSREVVPLAWEVVSNEIMLLIRVINVFSCFSMVHGFDCFLLRCQPNGSHLSLVREQGSVNIFRKPFLIFYSKAHLK